MNGVERVMQRIEEGEAINCLSCGEKIAAALLLNRLDLLPASYNHPLDAINRLGED